MSRCIRILSAECEILPDGQPASYLGIVPSLFITTHRTEGCVLRMRQDGCMEDGSLHGETIRRPVSLRRFGWVIQAMRLRGGMMGFINWSSLNPHEQALIRERYP